MNNTKRLWPIVQRECQIIHWETCWNYQTDEGLSLSLACFWHFTTNHVCIIENIQSILQFQTLGLLFTFLADIWFDSYQCGHRDSITNTLQKSSYRRNVMSPWCLLKGIFQARVKVYWSVSVSFFVLELPHTTHYKFGQLSGVVTELSENNNITCTITSNTEAVLCDDLNQSSKSLFIFILLWHSKKRNRCLAGRTILLEIKTFVPNIFSGKWLAVTWFINMLKHVKTPAQSFRDILLFSLLLRYISRRERASRLNVQCVILFCCVYNCVHAEYVLGHFHWWFAVCVLQHAISCPPLMLVNNKRKRDPCH